ncbi:MAG TPA: DUF1080 domain-containing protein, partial [Planctomycetaceae bacterium]|nr:DUF1080 domain-containing protein [Planctomycetaceae bacterium]
MKTLLVQTAVLIWATSVATIMAQDKPLDRNVTAAKSAIQILDSATWSDLFNGKDLSGWTGDTAGYVVEDGVLVCKKGGKEL